MSDIEFWRDASMDAMIEDIIEIFNNIEGVELVRLSGMTNRARRISGKSDIPPQAIDGIIRKLHAAGILKIKYITKCSHCGETSYQIIWDGISPINVKMCDTCNTFYQPIEGSTLEKV